MKVITPSDNEYKKGDDEIMVFLGGTCNGKNNWRNNVIKFLKKIEEDKVLSLSNLVIINPFISKWDPDDEALKKQIEWEANMIEHSDIYSCYFDCSSEAPVTFFELGCALFQFRAKFANYKLNHRIIVSAHPEFARLTELQDELQAVTRNWKQPANEVNVEKNVSAHASKILEAYMRFSK